MHEKKCVYQFKISLKEIAPTIWRRILVPPNYTFWDLHVAVQCAMGWTDSHLHLFSIKRPHARTVTEIGIPDLSEFEEKLKHLSGWEESLESYLEPGVTAHYLYDFGDNWEHDILLEGILIKEKGRKYPTCTGGEGKCPPEDCGGVGGYMEFLESVLNPLDEEHKQMLAWYGGEYDPHDFNPDEVRFDNPKKRLEVLLG